jgi:hypothetical protein
VIHEPGAVAGLTNRTLALVADRVIVAMEGAFERAVKGNVASHLPKPRRVALLGTPVRAEIAAVPAPDERYAGRGGACACWWWAEAWRADAERPRGRGDAGPRAGRTAAGRCTSRARRITKD